MRWRLKVSVFCVLFVSAAISALAEDAIVRSARLPETTNATIDGDKITADPAPSEATVWFLTVTDERDAIISSRIIIR